MKGSETHDEIRTSVCPDGPLALSAARRQMDYLRALLEYHHPKIASDPEWQTFAGLAQELASDAAPMPI